MVIVDVIVVIGSTLMEKAVPGAAVVSY